ncbi:MAG: hypothetical protein M3N29_01495 [Chloroflexota bacterium]|nr:hypothetical protein [Chloroflexota bacterium]
MDAISDFAWVTHLGRPLRVLRARRWLAVLLVVIWCIPVMIVAVLAGVFLQEPLGLSDVATMVMIGLLAAVALAVVGYWVGGRAGRAVVLYEHGIALRDADRIRAWSWDQIAAVTVARTVNRNTVTVAGIPLKTVEREDYRYTIRDRTGGVGILDGWFPEVVSVGVTLEDEVTRRVSGPLFDVYNSGGEAGFGPVGVSRQGGIRIGQRQLAWSNVAALRVVNGSLVVVPRDGTPSASMELGRIPNSRVLLALLDALAGRAS